MKTERRYCTEDGRMVHKDSVHYENFLSGWISDEDAIALETKLAIAIKALGRIDEILPEKCNLVMTGKIQEITKEALAEIRK